MGSLDGGRLCAAVQYTAPGQLGIDGLGWTACSPWFGPLLRDRGGRNPARTPSECGSCAAGVHPSGHALRRDQESERSADGTAAAAQDELRHLEVYRAG